MGEQEKKELEQLAAMMLDVDYSKLANANKSQKIQLLIEKKYGFSFDNFCNLVWDLLDFTPILYNERRNCCSHVLGMILDSKKSAFIALISKDCK